jgi:hypothetical protein
VAKAQKNSPQFIKVPLDAYELCAPEQRLLLLELCRLGGFSKGTFSTTYRYLGEQTAYGKDRALRTLNYLRQLLEIKCDKNATGQTQITLPEHWAIGVNGKESATRTRQERDKKCDIYIDPITKVIGNKGEDKNTSKNTSSSKTKRYPGSKASVEQIGEPPTQDKSLSPYLIQLFESLGKVEQYTNVWLSDEELISLFARYGEELIDHVGSVDMYEWSTGFDETKQGQKLWVNYREKTDHKKTIEGHIRRKQEWGLTFGGRGVGWIKEAA